MLFFPTALTQSRLDEVRSAVDVDRRAGDVAVPLGGQVGGDGCDLLGQPRATEIARLVEVVLDPRHDIVRVGRLEAVGGENVLEVFGEARGHDGPRAHAVHQDAFLGKAFGQILGYAGQRRLRRRVGDDTRTLPLNRVRGQRDDAG